MIVKVIIGPTASGKSALAVGRCLDAPKGVIINADAMQCYDALPVLTAQPGAEDTSLVPHRLYGVLDSRARLSAAGWAQMARREIEAAFKDGATPYIVGGTGLYIKALMEGLSPMPDIPPEVRSGLQARLEVEGLPALYADLLARDPASAERLKPGDTQRILRALEVVEGTGESLTAWQALPPDPPPPDWRFHVTQLHATPEVLDARIRSRLHAMLDGGALDEVAALMRAIETGITPADAPITVAHGFRHFCRVLRGEIPESDAFEATAIETRQYTKRQRTWLRHQIRADEVVAVT